MEAEVLARDYILIFAAMVGLAFVLAMNAHRVFTVRFLPLGRREDDLLKLYARLYGLPEARSGNFYPSKIELFPVLCSSSYSLWEVNLFSSTLLSSERIFLQTPEKNDYYFFEEPKNIIDPLLTKIFHRYGKFGKQPPALSLLRAHPQMSPDIFLTPFPNPENLQHNLFSFLDSCLAVAPASSLCLVWSQVIYLEVSFSFPTSIFSHLHFPFYLEQSEKEGKTVMYLWLAFAPEHIPAIFNKQEKPKRENQFNTFLQKAS